MKIIHIAIKAQFSDNWGYQENLLSEAHVELGHETVVIASTKNSMNQRVEEHKAGQYYSNGVKVIRIAPKFTLFKHIAKYDLYSIFQKENPDLIFFHSFTSCISLKDITKYKKYEPEVVYFADTHADEVNTSQTIFRKIFAWIFWKRIDNIAAKYIDVLYYTLPRRKEFIRKLVRIDEKKLRYLRMGVNIPHEKMFGRRIIRQNLRNRLGIQDSSVVFVTGGRHRRIKRTAEMLEGFIKVKNNDFKLLIFGKYESDDYKKEIGDIIQTDNRITDLGWLNQEEIEDLFLAADVAVMPGAHSVLWHSVVALGLPLICRYATGMEDLDFGGNCLFVDSDESFFWYQAINLINLDITLLSKMRSVAEKFASKSYDNLHIANSVIKDAEEFRALYDMNRKCP